MIRKIGLALIVGIGFALVGTTANAEERRTTPAAASTASERGYGYVFGDDLLAGSGMGANTASIIVRPRAAHATLIRPRVQFVTEMLKSVENI